MRWSDNQVTVNIFYGYVGSLTEAYFKCTQITPPKNIWSCEHLHAKSETSGKKHLDIIICCNYKNCNLFQI